MAISFERQSDGSYHIIGLNAQQVLFLMESNLLEKKLDGSMGGVQTKRVEKKARWRKCPFCDQTVIGLKGLAMHIRQRRQRPGDQAHQVKMDYTLRKYVPIQTNIQPAGLNPGQ